MESHFHSVSEVDLIKATLSQVKIFKKSKLFIVVLLFLILPGCAGNVDETRLFETMQKGLAHGDLGENRKATEAFSQAIKMAPELWDAHYEMGKALAALKRWPEAVLEFRKVIDLNPGYGPAYRELGKVLATSGYLKAALQNYTIALDKMSLETKTLDHAMILKEKAALLRLSGDCHQALVYYDRALKFLPRYSRALIESGWCLKEKGLLESGEERIQKGLDLSPKVVIALAAGGELELLKETVALGGDIDIQAQRNDQVTPLMAAVLNKHQNVINWLLEKGADPDLANSCGTTALHIALRTDNAAATEMLKKYGAKDTIRDCLGTLPSEHIDAF
ncbi:MAG: tetratricopeptide repeat protein [Deltaproteobacteria bacterium]|nr:tetratricopeptide repeat protein [Deltaproteobacteria bacterium]